MNWRKNKTKRERRYGAFPLKIFAVLLALTVWYAIHEKISNEIMLENIPLKIKTSNKLAVLDSSIKTVDILFRGSRKDIAEIDRERLQVEIDLRNGVAGTNQVVRFSSEDLIINSHARPVLFKPSTIKVRLDRRMTRKVPIKHDLIGTPMTGWKIEKVSLHPGVVEISGPARNLSDLDYIKTRPIDLNEIDQSFKVRKGLVLPRGLDQSEMDPEQVLIEVVLKNRIAKMPLESVPVRALCRRENGVGVSIIPGNVDLILKGYPDRLEEINLDQIRVYVDCFDLESTTDYELPVRVDLPDGVRADSIRPDYVQVRIQKE